MPNERFFEWFFNSDIFFSSKKSQKSKIWGYHDFFADESCRLATSQRRYNKLSHFFKIRTTLEIMKIGPATGTFLHIAQQNGHHVFGCDISSEFIEYAKKNYHVQIDQGRFEKKEYAIHSVINNCA